MNARIIARTVAFIWRDVAPSNFAASIEAHPGSDGVRAFAIAHVEQDGMPAFRGDVPEQMQRAVFVTHGQINVTVIIQIAQGKAATFSDEPLGGSGVGDLLEVPVAQSAQ